MTKTKLGNSDSKTAADTTSYPEQHTAVLVQSTINEGVPEVCFNMPATYISVLLLQM